MLRLDSLSLPLDFTPETLNALILRKLKCPPEQLKSVVLLKKAVDARDKADVHFVLSVAVTLKDEAKVLARLKPVLRRRSPSPKRRRCRKRGSSIRPLSSEPARRGCLLR